MLSSTPWEVYDVGGWPVHVKREDLCTGKGCPPFSKMRGVVEHLEGRPEGIIGVLDTYHSHNNALAYGFDAVATTGIN